jgi:hypothetical protein
MIPLFGVLLLTLPWCSLYQEDRSRWWRNCRAVIPGGESAAASGAGYRGAAGRGRRTDRRNQDSTADKPVHERFIQMMGGLRV